MDQQINRGRALRVPLGTPCYNCGAPLQGRWCHACGQSAEDFHRNAFRLVGEYFETLYNADGRLWRTLPLLVGNPARLTRDYLAGKRAPQIPPLRLFVVVLLVLFVVGNWTGAAHRWSTPHLTVTPAEDAAAARAQAAAAAAEIRVDVGEDWRSIEPATTWLRVHVARAVAHPDQLVAAMSARAQDFALLMLPISAVILWLIFALRRGVVLFDHLVFSMQSLSFQGMLISVLMIAGVAIGEGALMLLVAAPVHLFFHMRGTYRTGTAGTLARMAVLFIASMVGLAGLLAALTLIGLEELTS